jgi:hypothetical protein
VSAASYEAGTGNVRPCDRRAVRPVWQLAEQGRDWDRLGYPVLALWTACFVQAFEATHPEAA